MNLHTVKAGKFLHWPAQFELNNSRFRGAAGYVVDLDAPLEREWCAGQTHKLEPSAKGLKATTITHGPALKALQAHLSPNKKPPAPKPEPAKIAADLPPVDRPQAISKA